MHASPQPTFVVPSSPGGMARQFRVQFHQRDGEPWRLFATFTDRRLAESCLQHLDGRGYTTRLVAQMISPAAS